MNTGQKIQQMQERAVSPYVGPATREALDEALDVIHDLICIAACLTSKVERGSGSDSQEYQQAEAVLKTHGLEIVLRHKVTSRPITSPDDCT